PAHQAGAARTHTGPPPHRPAVDADRRRPAAPSLAHTPLPATATGVVPGRIGFDGRLLAGVDAVRLFGSPRGREGRGLLLRIPPDPDHRTTPRPGPGRRHRSSGPNSGGLGRRHSHRRIAARVHPSLGSTGAGARRGRGDLLRRPRSRRPGSPGLRVGPAVPAVSPAGVADPAPGRRPWLPRPVAGHDGGGTTCRQDAAGARPAQSRTARGTADRPAVGGAMIRLGSAAGYVFDGPRLLAGWTPPAEPGVYAVVYQPAPARQRFAVSYVGESEDLSREGFPCRHPAAPRWVERAGSKWKLAICTFQGPGCTAAHRAEIVRELVAMYQPRCNVERYERTWKDHWIGA